MRSECNECEDFWIAAGRYQRLNDRTIRSPKEILKERIAICPLKAKGRNNTFLIVLSVHLPQNEARRDGELFPCNYAYLLFDFLSKIDSQYLVLIAGDFKFDITLEPYNTPLSRLMVEYSIPHYTLRDLRDDKRSDFIMYRKSREQIVRNVSAHDLTFPDGVEQELIDAGLVVTRHNPLTADVTL